MVASPDRSEPVGDMRPDGGPDGFVDPSASRGLDRGIALTVAHRAVPGRADNHVRRQLDTVLEKDAVRREPRDLLALLELDVAVRDETRAADIWTKSALVPHLGREKYRCSILLWMVSACLKVMQQTYRLRHEST